MDNLTKRTTEFLKRIEEENPDFSIEEIFTLSLTEIAKHANYLIQNELFREKLIEFTGNGKPLDFYYKKRFITFAIEFARNLSPDCKEVSKCVESLLERINRIESIKQKILFLSFFFNLKIVPQKFKRKCIRTFINLSQNGSDTIKNTLKQIVCLDVIRIELSEEDLSLLKKEEIKLLLKLAVWQYLNNQKSIGFVIVPEVKIILPKEKILEVINKHNSNDMKIAKIYLYALKENNLLHLMYQFLKPIYDELEEEGTIQCRDYISFTIMKGDKVVSTLFDKIDSLNIPEEYKAEIFAFVSHWLPGYIHITMGFNIYELFSLIKEEKELEYYEEIFKKALESVGNNKYMEVRND